MLNWFMHISKAIKCCLIVSIPTGLLIMQLYICFKQYSYCFLIYRTS